MANVEDDASDIQEKMFERVVQYIENGSYPEGKTKGRPLASRASLYSAIEGRSRKCGGGVGPIAS